MGAEVPIPVLTIAQSALPTDSSPQAPGWIVHSLKLTPALSLSDFLV